MLTKKATRCVSLFCSLPIGGSAAIAEAVAAVDRTIVAGLKGHFAGLAALSAHGVKHLTGGVVVGAGDAFAGITAGFAALGLIGEAFLSIELLLTGGENEFLSAILADQGLVSVHEITSLSKMICDTVGIAAVRRCPAQFHSIYCFTGIVNGEN